jgi:hypothetical protein
VVCPLSSLLYHAFLPENHEHHVAREEIMRKGITHSTKSNNRYGNGGKVRLDITERLRPPLSPDWLHFEEGVGVDLTNRFSTSFCFPLFTDKILVFDGDISLSIYDQAFYEDFKNFDEEAIHFDTGKPIEYWIKHYWRSMMNVEDYLIDKPYSKPEILLFTPVPPNRIQLCDESTLNP